MYLYGIRNASLNMDWGKDAFAVAGDIGFDGVEIVPARGGAVGLAFECVGSRGGWAMG